MSDQDPKSREGPRGDERTMTMVTRLRPNVIYEDDFRSWKKYLQMLLKLKPITQPGMV